MVTSHGILGFETTKPADAALAHKFIDNLGNGMTIYDSYYSATIEAYPESKDIPYDIRAIAIFKNEYQRDHDYLPGKGTGVAPDGGPSDIPVVYCWHTKTGEPC